MKSTYGLEKIETPKKLPERERARDSPLLFLDLQRPRRYRSLANILRFPFLSWRTDTFKDEDRLNETAASERELAESEMKPARPEGR
jgi:hypothetical protein